VGSFASRFDFFSSPFQYLGVDPDGPKLSFPHSPEHFLFDLGPLCVDSPPLRPSPRGGMAPPKKKLARPCFSRVAFMSFRFFFVLLFRRWTLPSSAKYTCFGTPPLSSRCLNKIEGRLFSLRAFSRRCRSPNLTLFDSSPFISVCNRTCGLISTTDVFFSAGPFCGRRLSPCAIRFVGSSLVISPSTIGF